MDPPKNSDKRKDGPNLHYYYNKIIIKMYK